MSAGPNVYFTLSIIPIFENDFIQIEAWCHSSPRRMRRRKLQNWVVNKIVFAGTPVTKEKRIQDHSGELLQKPGRKWVRVRPVWQTPSVSWVALIISVSRRVRQRFLLWLQVRFLIPSCSPPICRVALIVQSRQLDSEVQINRYLLQYICWLIPETGAVQ